MHFLKQVLAAMLALAITFPFSAHAPAQYLSRADVVRILYEMEPNPPEIPPPFSDVEPDDYAIGWAAAEGIVAGCGENMFDPDSMIKREQMAIILYNYHRRQGYEMRTSDISQYQGAEFVAPYARTAMEWLITGDGLRLINGGILSGEQATRADLDYALVALRENRLFQERTQEQIAATYASVPWGTPIYAEPSQTSNVVTRYQTYTHMFVAGESGDFYLVHLPGGIAGYLYKVGATLEHETITPPTVTHVKNNLTEDKTRKALEALQQQYPDGMYWNNPAGTELDTKRNDQDTCLSSIPCNHNQTDMTCAHHVGIASAPFLYPSAMQCLGFASMISNTIFGQGAPIRVHQSWTDLKVGDMIRLIKSSHAFIVTSIDHDNDTVQVLECNRDCSTCVIRWGRTVSEAAVQSEPYDIVTRYPDVRSDGSSQVIYAVSPTVLRLDPAIDSTVLFSVAPGEFLCVIARNPDGWSLLSRENGEMGWGQISEYRNYYKVS